MFSSLKEQLDYEYSRFRSLTLLETKSAVYAAAEEICLKRRIVRVLGGLELEKPETERLLATRDLLDKVYLLVQDAQDRTEKRIEQTARNLAAEEEICYNDTKKRIRE